jgi:outer membrane protein assembly complex protein YaeT
MRSVWSSSSPSSRPLSRAALLAIVAVALIAPVSATAARSDPALRRRAAARLSPTGPAVKEIVFAGNSAFEDEELISYMRTRETGLLNRSYYDRRTFLQDLANLERFYVSEGFLEADVEMDDISVSADSLSVRILIGVYEGDRWTIGGVSFKGQSVIPEGELRSLVILDEGSPFIVADLKRDRRVLSEAYATRSYLDARVAQDVVRDDEARLVFIDYKITEREQARIASIDVVGDDKTRQYVVERELTFREGELFDFRKIGESQANIHRTGLFNSVWIEPAPADTGKPEKGVVVRVSERASGEFDLSVNYAGISLTEGLQGADFFELGAELRNRNVQGQATTMSIAGSYGGLARDVRASVGDPWFLGTRLGAEIAAQYEWKDEESFISEVVGGSFLLTKKLGLNVALEGGYEYSQSYVQDGEDAGTTQTTDILFAATYDSRDDVLSPSRGIYLRGEGDLASSRLGGMNDFARLDLDCRGYAKPRRGRVVALQLRAGLIDPHGGTSEVPLTERYIPGREGFVRGLPGEALGPVDDDGDPSGGMGLFLARAEGRFPVYGSLRGAVFVDAGRVFERMEDIDLSELGVGAGVGVRFETRIGVLRLDVGWPVSKDGTPQYYFGVGQAF